MSEIQTSPRLSYPKFTKEMRLTHKILIPQMLLIHFALIEKIVGRFPDKMLQPMSSRKRRHFDEQGRFLLDELHHSEQKHVREQLTLQVRQ